MIKTETPGLHYGTHPGAKIPVVSDIHHLVEVNREVLERSRLPAPMQPHFGFETQLLPNAAVEKFAKAFQTELVPCG